MYTPNALLDAVVKALTLEKGDTLVSPWFSETSAIAVKDGRLVISAPSQLIRDTLETRFTDNVSDIIASIFEESLVPLYLCEEEVEHWRMENNESVYSSYTFERFIVGNSNKFAHAAALAVAKKPAGLYNPLFIYGGSGLGKTHLLYAIAGYIRNEHPSFRIVYIKCEEFINELIDALQNGFTEFRAKYRRADLLLVDDIQFLAGKNRMQEEFFNTFETLHQAGKQMVLTSDRPPKEIATLSARLVSRFEMGLLADIQSPDLETRMALIKSKSEMMGVRLPPEIVEFIASTITNNVRELEGTVKYIAAKHSLMGMRVDMTLAQEAIKDIFKARPGLHPTPDLILEEVAAFYDVAPAKIRSNSKTRDSVIPRQITAYLIRELTGMSLPEIGEYMGQHHTTIMYSINKLDERLKDDEALQNAVSDMRKNIQAR